MNPAAFERHRSHLTGLAYRMLGSVSAAEDSVQETWLRWEAAGTSEIHSPRAWLTRTCTRICLDQLKSARHRREDYVGEWLPEPWVEAQPTRLERDETLSMALLHTIERLRPKERAAFLLREVFDYDFEDIAEMLETSPANCRQLTSRARKRLKGPPAQAVDAATHQRLGQAFFGALRSGDLGALEDLLTEEVILTSDGGGKATAALRPVLHRRAVLRLLKAIYLRRPRELETREVWFNGGPGVLLLESGVPVSAFAFEVRDGCIGHIFVQRNPDKLAGFMAPPPRP